MNDNDKETTTLWGLPVIVEDSPLTRFLGYYVRPSEATPLPSPPTAEHPRSTE